MKTKSTPRDPALVAAKRYFKADTELKALKARSIPSPDDLSETDRNRRWASALREREAAQLDLAFTTPSSFDGALEALRVATDRLDGLHHIIREVSGGSSISSIIKQAQRALRAVEAKRNAELKASEPMPAPQMSAITARPASARPPLATSSYAQALTH